MKKIAIHLSTKDVQAIKEAFMSSNHKISSIFLPFWIQIHPTQVNADL
jgi:hypothetical protein